METRSVRLCLVLAITMATPGLSQDFALHFDGAQHVDGSSATLPQGNLPRTLEAWIRLSTPGQVGNIFGYGTRSANQRSSIIVESGFFEWVGEGNDLIGSIPISAGEWTHVAASYDGTTMSLYVNGVLDTAAPIPPHNATGTSWRMGMVIGSANEAFLGDIDEVRAWEVARTQAEIVATMRTRLSGSEPGLVGYWRLDDGPGSVVAVDSSPSSSSGVLMGFEPTTAWVFPGALTRDYALHFDGAQRVDGVDTSLPQGNLPRTLEAWIRVTTPMQVGNIFGYGTRSGNQRSAIIIEFGFLEWVGEGNDLIGSIPISAGEWTHVAASYDGTIMSLYVNGVLDTAVPIPPHNATGTSWRMGMVIGSAGEAFFGDLDEVRVWDVARTQAEIQAAMGARPSGSDPGLVGYWRLDDGTGSLVAADYSASESHGELIGFDPATAWIFPGALLSIFEDGFEGGNTDRWSTTSP